MLPAWTCKPHADLTPAELYAILRLRSAVFVVEQNCVFLDMDGKDLQGQTEHLMAWRDGRLLVEYHKRLLPTYDVFDEDRYFEPGERPVVVDVAGIKVGLSICEDLWKGEDAGFAQRYRDAADPVVALVEAGAQVIVNPSASPFVLGKGKRLFSSNSQPRAFKLTHSAVSPNGLIAATYVRAGEVKTATVGGAFEPSATELARREKLKREG